MRVENFSACPIFGGSSGHEFARVYVALPSREHLAEYQTEYPRFLLTFRCWEEKMILLIEGSPGITCFISHPAQVDK